MGKLVSVVKHVDARELIVRTVCVMYVILVNMKKNVVPNKLSIAKLVGVIIVDDIRTLIFFLQLEQPWQTVSLTVIVQSLEIV